jgi:hypothetical protein
MWVDPLDNPAIDINVTRQGVTLSFETSWLISSYRGLRPVISPGGNRAWGAWQYSLNEEINPPRWVWTFIDGAGDYTNMVAAHLAAIGWHEE